MINIDKSSISFENKVSGPVKKEAQSILGILKEGGAGKYLDLPECFSGSKVEMLNYLKDRMKGKLSGWFDRTLSQGGKEVLLKSVAMAMPIFAMSCFKLPVTTCSALSSALADYWWSSCEHSRKIHWQSWEKLCLPKHLGGMGFRDIGLFNQALLAKQAWRILQVPNSLLARLLKSRYFPVNDFLNAGLGNRPSYGWRSISFGKELLAEGLVKKVGNGASINVWGELWIEDVVMHAPLMKNDRINIDLKVEELIDFSSRGWNLSKLEDLFYPADVQRILKHKPVVSKNDFLVWKLNKSGQFSVKSAYWLAYQINKAELLHRAADLPSISTLKEQVWKLQTDPKIQTFLWKILSGAVPVADGLQTRGLKTDDLCQICGLAGESINHVIFNCSIARQVWALSNYPHPLNGFDNGSVFSNIHHLLVNCNNELWPVELRSCFPWIVWTIWKNRNLFLFKGESFSPLESVKKIRNDAEEWFLAQKLGLEEDREVIKNRGFHENAVTKLLKPWSAPPLSWVKCNIGFSWSKRNKFAGASWVLRDEKGLILLHSRRAFSGVIDVFEAKLLVFMWAIESMISHKIEKVEFALEDVFLVGVVISDLKPLRFICCYQRFWTGKWC
ncbi:unnamed protein product [Microthlaspi erraticum]|uniref:Reverse transcriptase zinc-binding domain-containing protein n=1 Tax=Microthlaspi erraticum TaxID=1685480 RepID=A0A6D2IVB0_9BRAS|nr:unnamed protein product [Microthlaspi erraticum]